jgi:hypothetical protein
MDADQGARIATSSQSTTTTTTGKRDDGTSNH